MTTSWNASSTSLGLKVGDPLDPATQVGSLISAEHLDRVHSYVETGREEGAQVLTGGEQATARAPSTPRPCSQVDNNARRPGGDLRPGRDDDPLRDGRTPSSSPTTSLWPAGTIWTTDPGRGHRSRAHQGRHRRDQHPFTAFPGIPFGGYKQSGFGRELGLETLDDYLETKSVIVSTSPKPFNPFGL